MDLVDHEVGEEPEVGHQLSAGDEADANPSKAIGNAQAIQRVLATLPSEVCRAIQTDPDGEFVKAETIAPIAAELLFYVTGTVTAAAGMQYLYRGLAWLQGQGDDDAE